MAERARSGKGRGKKASLNPDDSATSRDASKSDTESRRRLVNDVLETTGTFRSTLREQGCVCVALPPSFNPRLASQQGVFLLNGSEELTFEGSLLKMMGSSGHENWCRAFDIPADLLSEIEGRLFQMNIHEQSLFPDMAGLAGLIKQKIRLHFTSII
jgi:hypothetical protein